MSLVIKANGVFTFPPDQLCILEHNGKKLHCNVDLLIADYKEKQAEKACVNNIYKPNDGVNSRYAMTTDISKPIIIVRFDDGIYEVLDGNHRLFRAAQEGKLYIKAHILNETEMEKYIMN